MRVAFTVRKVVFKTHGFGRVGINFKPFDSKVLAFSVRGIFHRFVIICCYFFCTDFYLLCVEKSLFIFAKGWCRVGAVVV